MVWHSICRHSVVSRSSIRHQAMSRISRASINRHRHVDRGWSLLLFSFVSRPHVISVNMLSQEVGSFDLTVSGARLGICVCIHQVYLPPCKHSSDQPHVEYAISYDPSAVFTEAGSFGPGIIIVSCTTSARVASGSLVRLRQSYASDASPWSVVRCRSLSFSVISVSVGRHLSLL